jgi:hypothetical protein
MPLNITFDKVVILNITPDFVSNAIGNNVIGIIGSHPRTYACHQVPIIRVGKDARDEGPGPAHFWFDRMNGAYVVPEHAIAVLFLC